MVLPVYLQDGWGTRNRLKITPEGAIKTTVTNASSFGLPATELTRYKLLYESFTLNGSDDLNVDGSTTSQEFSVSAAVSTIKWVNQIRILFNSEQMEIQTNDFRRFGDAGGPSGLAEGILLQVHQGAITTDLFVEPIITIGDFMNYADHFTNFVNAISSQSDFLSFDFHFSQPVVMPDGSQDRISCVVQDDLTDLSLFHIIARGYQEVQ